MLITERSSGACEGHSEEGIYLSCAWSFQRDYRYFSKR
ncbi:hypothetical protein UPM260_1771 [Salmonella enterica subsp. enterica serovar Typhimurium]|nr:hypothetical protein UPM260_1771 [Salmonella enterica subsp. enterica serovar Typhimurium]